MDVPLCRTINQSYGLAGVHCGRSQGYHMYVNNMYFCVCEMCVCVHVRDCVCVRVGVCMREMSE